MKSSIVIPCHSTHCRFILNLIKIYKKQSKLPYEMIIVCSKIDNTKIIEEVEQIKKKVEEMNLEFNVIFKVFKNRQYAGKNRKIGAHTASGDIIIFQDADDLPHKDRISIIEYFFKKYNPLIIGHHYLCGSSWRFDDLKQKKINNLKFSLIKGYQDLGFTNGNIAISKSLVKKINNWFEKTKFGEDLKLTKYIMNTFRKTLIIHYSLIYYREKFSSHK